jgi:hypothetical protein
MIVACYLDPRSSRSSIVARAMAEGIAIAGDKAVIVEDWNGPPIADAAIGYGWRRPDLFQRYRAEGKFFVYLDLGWWGRKPEGDLLGGYHKVVVNDREPNDYFRRSSPADRFDHFGLRVKPWRSTGSHILLAGMSAKSAGTRGFKPHEWELGAIAAIREATDRPIVYRPKPSWNDATPIPGTRFSPRGETLADALADCWAVATFHSNVAVDALLAGIPAYCETGVGAELSMTGIAALEDPPLPTGREQLMADIAYVQWHVAEMQSGECWRYLRENTPLSDGKR